MCIASFKVEDQVHRVKREIILNKSSLKVIYKTTKYSDCHQIIYKLWDRDPINCRLLLHVNVCIHIQFVRVYVYICIVFRRYIIFSITFSLMAHSVRTWAMQIRFSNKTKTQFMWGARPTIPILNNSQYQIRFLRHIPTAEF